MNPEKVFIEEVHNEDFSNDNCGHNQGHQGHVDLFVELSKQVTAQGVCKQEDRQQKTQYSLMQPLAIFIPMQIMTQ